LLTSLINIEQIEAMWIYSTKKIKIKIKIYRNIGIFCC
jgi:hypothetical protein